MFISKTDIHETNLTSMISDEISVAKNGRSENEEECYTSSDSNILKQAKVEVYKSESSLLYPSLFVSSNKHRAKHEQILPDNEEVHFESEDEDPLKIFSVEVDLRDDVNDSSCSKIQDLQINNDEASSDASLITGCIDVVKHSNTKCSRAKNKSDDAEPLVVSVDPVFLPDIEDRPQGNVYPCKLCERTFPLEQLLVLHERNHMRERKYRCGKCSKTFYTNGDLHKHETVHWNKKPFSCVVCSKAFARKNLLTRHENIHRDEKRVSCSFCSKTFLSLVEKGEHEKDHKRDRQFQCKICEQKFAAKHSLVRHESRHHGSDLKFSCDYCREMFSSQAKLSRHLISHVGGKPFPCKLCSKSFSLSHHLTRHMRGHAAEKQYTCEHCSKAFSRRESLDIHIRSHTGERPYGCIICDKLFQSNTQRTRHMKIHAGKPYHCPQCKRSFFTEADVEKHIRISHKAAASEVAISEKNEKSEEGES